MYCALIPRHLISALPGPAAATSLADRLALIMPAAESRMVHGIVTSLLAASVGISLTSGVMM